jgi:hypothetical protein
MELAMTLKAAKKLIAQYQPLVVNEATLQIHRGDKEFAVKICGCWPEDADSVENKINSSGTMIYCRHAGIALLW